MNFYTKKLEECHGIEAKTTQMLGPKLFFCSNKKEKVVHNAIVAFVFYKKEAHRSACCVAPPPPFFLAWAKPSGRDFMPNTRVQRHFTTDLLWWAPMSHPHQPCSHKSNGRLFFLSSAMFDHNIVRCIWRNSVSRRLSEFCALSNSLRCILLLCRAR